MIIGVNLNHDYAYCEATPQRIYVKEAERFSRIRHHWNTTSYTLSILDELTPEQLVQTEAVYLNTPRIHKAPKRRGGLSSYRREYIYRGDYVEPETQSGIAYGTLTVGNIKISAAWVSHYHAHALSSLWASGFEEADVFCLDGGGDFGYYGAAFIGTQCEVHLRERLMARHGRSYHDFSQCVYGAKEGFYESKVMAMASYGTKDWSQHQILGPSGELGEIPSPISVHDIARFQADFEESILEILRKMAPTSDSLCCAGGCFLNVGLNRRIAEAGLYKRIYVPPFTGDVGTAIGCALYGHLAIHGRLPARALVESPFLGDNISISVADLTDVITNAGDLVITK
jgi:predicted NodU family carbamoyl transferase